jgi:hypothetical protein
MKANLCRSALRNSRSFSLKSAIRYQVPLTTGVELSQANMKFERQRSSWFISTLHPAG